MSYEIYRRVHTEDEYFAIWDPENVKDIDDSIKYQIYQRYKIKCQVFQRDNFKCVNEKCAHKSEKLEMHHVLPQSHGGVDSTDNCVTLCHICHKHYHSGRKPIIMNGEEFTADNFEKMQQRQNKFLMRKFRKELKYIRPDCFGCEISVESLIILLRFLNKPYDEY